MVFLLELHHIGCHTEEAKFSNTVNYVKSASAVAVTTTAGAFAAVELRLLLSWLLQLLVLPLLLLQPMQLLLFVDLLLRL